jgi:hypothetical protein
MYLALVIFILAAALFVYNNTDLFFAIKQETMISAENLAESGLAYTQFHLSDFKLNADRLTYDVECYYTENEPLLLQDPYYKGKFRIQAKLLNPSTNNGTGGPVEIESTGYIKGHSKTIHAVFKTNSSGSDYQWYP